MEGTPGRSWSITARNLPEHAGNPIHTDAGARAAGFERALVAGVTSYAYCCHPVLERLGLEWVASGAGEVRFRSPVFDGERLDLVAGDRADGGLDVAVTAERAERPLVEMAAWPTHPSPTAVRPGEELEPVVVRLEGEYGADYAARAGDGAALLPDGIVHPALWPALANRIFHAQLVRGSWVHTRSIVRHHALADGGGEAEVTAVVVRRFHRHGERAVADVTIRVDGTTVATLEHEAIIDLGAVDS